MCHFLFLMGLLASAPLIVMSASEKAPEFPSIPEPAPAAGRAQFGSRIPRTMALLAESTPERRWPVKIIFYGQSITEQEWWKTVAVDLRTQFPNAQLTVDNLAIGGFGFGELRHTAEHDIFPNYPDLVLLQAYDPSAGAPSARALDKLVSEIRTRTTAEIMLCTHHVCLPARRPEWDDATYEKALQEHQKEREAECAEIRRVAAKYGCELVDIRPQWLKYLQDNKLQTQAMLNGNIHLNDRGCALMAKLISPHFQYVKDAKNPWSDCILTQPVTPEKDGRTRVQFTGNRIDVIASTLPGGANPAAAKVLIDGKAPSEDTLLYAITRPGTAPLGAWWPAIRKIGHKSPLILEDWTLHITKCSSDASDADFDVSGSVTGPDGSGNTRKPFVSNSGRVIIDPKDLKIANAIPYFKKPMPKDYQVTWSVIPQFVSIYKPPADNTPGRVRITTLAQGLANGAHTLELIPEGDGKVAIDAVRIHRPPGTALAAN